MASFRRIGTASRPELLLGLTSAAVVAAAVVFTFVHLQPGLLFTDNTPAGGDMGAHVWGPAFLRDHLLPEGRLTGWTPDWYAGFPAYHFYMVVPSLAIVALDLVLPYGIAFKLITVSGLLALPVAVLLAPWGILALLLIPIGVLDAELVYRGLGWARVGDHIVARRGGLLRETNVVPMAKVQSTRLASSPLQRRVGLANLLLDVAGRGRTPAVLDGAADDLGPLHLGALGTLAARRDEQAVRRRSTAEIAATPKAAST